MEKYVKVRKIGEGAFGKAELVKRKDDGNQMVIKEINIIRMNAKEREEARKEVAVLAQLKHPNIVAYRESFEERGCLFIVMDYCSGGDLYAKINNQRGVLFGEDQILDWFVQMCLAIKHIHDRKILHRDIKSQNIFLTSRGQVQLGDFGIAKVLNSTVELARTCIGTPYYLSPEICENLPYNNKSDVWSLGCVLYELASLKHAFEAGNMKNLVLKIIRGSYPPLSPKYSYELRNLVAQLFKRAPRDRPSINSILKKSFISQRVPKFLSSEELESEFSHTVMHGHKLGRALPPPPNPAARPPSASRSRPDSAGPAAASAAKKYDPSKIYGQPVVRKSKENRAPGDVRKRPGSAGSGSRPGSAAGSRPGSAGNRPASSQEIQKKKMELLEKEKVRREEEKKREFERRRQELQEKQKKENQKQENKEPARVPVAAAPPPQVAPRPGAVGAGDYNGNAGRGGAGKYEQYNQYLDKLERERELRQKQQGVPLPQKSPAAYMAAPMAVPRPLPAAPRNVRPVPADPWRRAPEPSPMYQPYNERGQNQSEQRAQLVDEFINRRREAAINKHRGQAELFGPSDPAQRRAQTPDKARPSGADQKPTPAGGDRNKEEQEYLERLRQIRQQNYNERRNLQAKVEQNRNPNAEERKKKAEALKKQAEDWAKQRQEELEKKKQEFLDKERQAREQRQMAALNRGVKPGPAMPITGAVNAIGAKPRVVEEPPKPPTPGMTNALGAIGVQARVVNNEEPERAKTPLQKQKEDILKKANEKGPPQGAEEAVESARPKWGAGDRALKFAESEADADSSRSQWGAPNDLDLGKLTLEETSSQMEATSARDRVIVNPDSARRQWGRPGATVVKALQGVPLVEQTFAMPSDESGGSQSSASTNESPAVTAGPGPVTGVGSTITISSKPTGVAEKSPAIIVARSPIAKGTITLRTADQNKPGADITSEETILSELTPVKEASACKTQSPTKGKSPSHSPAKRSPVPSPVSELSTDNNKNEHTEASEEDKQAVDNEEQSKSLSNVNQKPPVPTRKPPLPDKPVVLPKPVLLPKPDAPKEFASSQPVSVKNVGAGTLFEKVELEDENQSDKGKKDSSQSENSEDKVVVRELPEEGEKPMKKTGLVLGITMGSFDIGHRELLRTCSEPDLASLFKTMAEEMPCKAKAKSVEDMTTVNEEEESLEDVYDNMGQAVLSAEAAGDEEEDLGAGVDVPIGSSEVAVTPRVEGQEENEGKKQEADDNDGDDVEFQDDEDEDLQELMSVRESMQRVVDSDEDSQKSPIKFSLSSDRESRMSSDRESGNGGADLDTEEDQMDGEEGVDNEAGNEGEQEEEIIDQDVADGDVNRSISVDNENIETPEDSHDDQSELFPTDDSDSEFNDGDDAADFDVFGRLEASRAQLEEALGATKLVRVYKTVQALMEDEDENMEEGARLAIEMLGADHKHLYPQIFQLVMADAAFTDDNLS
ncbi:serine/threonine-protein kinase Nek1-like isoform X2 [Dreissena polymorpha]|uniref:serine/threonine-protein kinase Nek1-like isoform X2 n=1 Tax=Dreissena polymorpha TaxID=45954 RepID=UPI002264D39C|nr:serine/threonine-protein kinase Nek1-like isoform X2 [Dreissena polymorpha]